MNLDEIAALQAKAQGQPPPPPSPRNCLGPSFQPQPFVYDIDKVPTPDGIMYLVTFQTSAGTFGVVFTEPELRGLVENLETQLSPLTVIEGTSTLHLG